MVEHTLSYLLRRLYRQTINSTFSCFLSMLDPPVTKGFTQLDDHYYLLID